MNTPQSCPCVGCVTSAPPTTGRLAIYRASHDDYAESTFPTGLPFGTCEDALDLACGLYLGDPTAWHDLRPPTN